MYALQGDPMLAVEYCHKALDKERQDPFTIQLLEMSLSALALSSLSGMKNCFLLAVLRQPQK